MTRRSLLALPALIFALSCDGSRDATGPRLSPSEPSGIISDGAHGGNPDFFFLPPMVPPPFQHPDFEGGAFNPRLQASLKIEICELAREPLDPNLPATRPLTTTPCAAVPLIKTFAPGSVDLVGVPSQQSGWWSNFNLPSDGFYKVLWDTREHALSLDKYYRIKVLIHGSDEPLGYADVDPVSNMREWKHVMTGELVTMIDDTKLPIAFRVETGALCGEATQCGSATITNDNPNGDTQVLQVLNEGGVPVAGVLVPDGWLPPDGPQSVVISIARVNTGTQNVAAGTQQLPCHANLPLQQFDGCFNFRTIPELEPIDESGRQFATPIIGAVCFVLADSDDPREPYVQLWSSEPDEEGDQPKALRSADANQILTGNDGRNCGGQVVASTSSNPLLRVASAGWQILAKGFGHAFGVKTAYAVDLGIGGILDEFSNVGPAMSAEIQGYTSTEFTIGAGATTTSTARVVGTQRHDGSALTTGIGGVPVTYTVAAGNGTLNALGTTGGTATEVTVTSNTNPIDGESPTSGGGFAPVNWTLPTTPGTYTLTATARARGGPVTFTATVPQPVLSVNVLSGPWVNESTAGTAGIASVNMGPNDGGFVVQSWGNCSPWDCDWGVTSATTTGWAGSQQITAFWDQEYATRTQTITYLSSSRIQVVTVTDFTEADGRTDYTLTEFFQRPSLSLLGSSWTNTASDATAGITRVVIGVEGTAATVQSWGNCEPTDCDWGTTTANTTGWGSTYTITAFWDQGFATRTQTIQFMSLDYIWVRTFTDFTEADGRTDYTLNEYFRLDT